MIQSIQLRVDPKTATENSSLKRIAAKELRVDEQRVKQVDIMKRSIDARQRKVMVNLTVMVHIDTIDRSASVPATVEYECLAPEAPSAIVVGAGPAGLFASLRLIEEGIKPILLERGKDVDSRRRDMAAISREGIVDPDSNYCFGEGGAGAYSDGKLYTRSKKRGSVEKILRILHQHGATRDILVDAHPHIGTDKLPEVIKSIRQTIIRCGGEVHFRTRVDELVIDNGSVNGVAATDLDSGNKTLFEGPVILATGHSARDVYESLCRSKVDIEAKGLAIGVRLEHPQKLIDCIQYHSKEGRGRYLPAAEYSMLTRVNDRAVYSFCMCPGGFIIPAASGPRQLVVNGMSPSNRGTRWANSGMVVEILPEDISGDDPLKMLYLQQDIERGFFEEANSYNPENRLTQNAPAQRMIDFVEGRESDTLPATSYAPGIHPARIDCLLPDFISKRLQKGFMDFGRKSRGFLTNDAVLIGCETRTSSPVRIPRNPETLVHVSINGLYPCGEGAGYAGGIVSAAIDGERSAESLARTVNS